MDDSEISDKEFIGFLQSLRVETYNKSFEWMLNDERFAVLRWLYNHLDENNVLSAREEYRYSELEKQGNLLSNVELESSVDAIQSQFPNICLPGDQEAKEDVKLNIKMLKERLHKLENQEVVIQDLIQQDDEINKKLELEITKLNSRHQQVIEEANSLTEKCTELAHNVEVLTEKAVDVIGDSLEGYASCNFEKEKAKRFLTFSPLDSYRQSQILFRSHFDLFMSRHLAKQVADANEQLSMAIGEAKMLEERLSAAAYAYIESEADLGKELAKLALLTDYTDVHHSQVTSCLLEAESSLKLLEQEENIAEQQVRNTVSEFVKQRTDGAVNSATAAAYRVRLSVQSSLSQLVSLWQRACAVDKLLYHCLRHELTTFQEVLQFAEDLMAYVRAENDAVRSRLEAMNKICQEQGRCEDEPSSSNKLLQLLLSVIGKPINTNDPTMLVKMYNELDMEVKELKEAVNDGFKRKERALCEFEQSTQPLKALIWRGCHKQPNARDRTVTELTGSIEQRLQDTSGRIKAITAQYMNAVQNGDKNKLRKLWQWFLADPAKLLAEMKKVQAK